jgi:thiamine-monophosphate kinase
MRLKDIGERALIERFIEKLGRGKGENLEDDCAFISMDNQYLLLTSDMISKKTHIPPEISPKQIGWFIIAINLSDLAAKGGKPMGLLLSLGLPSNTPLKFVEGIAEGASECASFFNTSILGGDTKENLELTLAGTAIGKVRKRDFMARKGAKPGDLVCVTGEIGKGGAGLFALKDNLLNKLELALPLFEPMPRIKEGIALARSGSVSASMDISDGLACSLYQLKRINNCGFEIEIEKIPISREAKEVINQLSEKQQPQFKKEFLLYSGGDYELLLTIKSEAINQAVKLIESLGSKLTPIGKVTKEKRILLIEEHKHSLIQNRGYEHFRYKPKWG